jgi:hypothetical protein
MAQKLEASHSRLIKTLLADMHAAQAAVLKFVLNEMGLDHMKFGLANDLETVVEIPQQVQATPVPVEVVPEPAPVAVEPTEPSKIN